MMSGVGAVIVIGLLVAWGVGALDRHQRADDAAVRLQQSLGEALTREPRLSGASILPVATTLPGGRPSVELTGTVDSPAARRLAREIVRRELAALRPGATLVDRLEIRRTA